jgi:apolipoprotein N-acyltransferase
VTDRNAHTAREDAQEGPSLPAQVGPRRQLLLLALTSLATGLAWASAHPGPSIWWLIFLVVPGWLTVAHLTRGWSLAWTLCFGFLLGMAAFLPMLRWIAAPATTFGWLLLASTQAAWVAAATGAVRRWTTGRRVAVIGPVIWTGMEVLRARLPLTGFGWGDLATAHTDASWMLTVARVLGADGLTLLTASLGAFVWVTVVHAVPVWRSDEQLPSGPTVVPAAARMVAVLDAVRPTMIGAVAIGALGTLITAELPPTIQLVDVLVVQGNDGAQTFVGDAEDQRIANAHADATVAAIADGPVPDLTVWAENALDRDPSTDAGSDLLPALQRAAAATDGRLLTGVIRAGDDAGTFRNSLVVVRADGALGDAYDKQQVVPFGEYVPWRSLLGDFPPLRQVPRDAIGGTGPVTLTVGEIKIAAVICFETLFAPLVHAAVNDGDAGLVVAGTNDASFGRGAESAQHVNQSRLRAVETGRTVIHAAISGTSAIITPQGEITELTPVFEVATIRATVPIVTGRTPAAVIARPFSLLLTAAALALTALGPLLERRRTRTAEAAS